MTTLVVVQDDEIQIREGQACRTDLGRDVAIEMEVQGYGENAGVHDSITIELCSEHVVTLIEILTQYLPKGN